jgi:hypothetical protein
VLECLSAKADDFNKSLRVLWNLKLEASIVEKKNYIMQRKWIDQLNCVSRDLPARLFWIYLLFVLLMFGRPGF